VHTFHAADFSILPICLGSWDSTVGIATGYRLNDRVVGVRLPVGARIFSSPRRPDRFWSPPSLLSNGYRGSFPGGKAAGVWSWSLISNKCRGQENVDLYIHSPIRLNGLMLNQLSTGAPLPYPFVYNIRFNPAERRHIRRPQNGAEKINLTLQYKENEWPNQ
jgi:hypothetical protein